MTPTRNSQTENRYLSRARTLIQRYLKTNKISEIEDGYTGLVQWLASRQPHMRPATWRQNKASIYFYLSSFGYNEAADLLSTINSEDTKKVKDKTSSLKKKCINQREEDKIRKALIQDIKESSGYLSKPLLAIFESLLTTGMRPVEMNSATIINDNEPSVFKGEAPFLMIKNGKNSNGRTFGEYRYVGISSYSEKQIAMIKLGLKYMRECKDENGEQLELNDYYNRLRAKFRRIIKRALPETKKHISLYSCRHQFIANLKLQKYTLIEIAAIVGHGVTDTAEQTYGRKRYGKSGGVKPVANELHFEHIKNHQLEPGYTAQPDQTL